MNVETATNMHDLREAVNWLAKNIDRDELDADNEVEQAYFDFCMRILPNAGHILNDSVGDRTARDYLTFPGKTRRNSRMPCRRFRENSVLIIP